MSTPKVADSLLLTRPRLLIFSDWKSVVYSNQPLNSGDDIAGVVEAVGDTVVGFRKGDRVAAFHQMRTAHGSFAEYAIAPAHTAFHLPDHTSFEEVSWQEGPTVMISTSMPAG